VSEQAQVPATERSDGETTPADVQPTLAELNEQWEALDARIVEHLQSLEKS
jgi:hypothetical protein